MDFDDLLEVLQAMPPVGSIPPALPPAISVGTSTVDPLKKSLFWEGVGGFLSLEFEIRRKSS